MNADRHVAVVTPWYPDPQVPYAGAFVEAQVEAVSGGCARLDVYHLKSWSVGAVGRPLEANPELLDLHTRLLARSRVPLATAGGAVLHRVPTLTPRDTAWVTHSDASARWLREALGGEPLAAPIVHAHVPITAGWAALENARPDAKVYITEHSSFLDRVLEQPRARARYEEVLERADGFFVVGEPLHDRIAAEFPHLAGNIEYLSNPIDFGGPRREAPAVLHRWLSVAALNERKRIDYLLEAFRRCRDRVPDLTLTLAGDGKLRKDLGALARDLGLDDAVTFVGSVAPREVPGLMASHDLFVHTSRHETFGVVVVEALAAGTPVLVSRCGGSDQVLRGIESEAGQLFDVDDDPDVLVAAYLELRERHPDKTDVPAARERLRAQYSYETVAERHFQIWDGGADR
ncbi:glycosyltransferase [Glycomyces sp. TRM65418]|uniref:glycosyltransferase n=1 Tax=Glycomyces sp. TRM65418 TaxID=2867006 RepID=UPI001CE553FC|nr:glycosyltransferase [Glycomyces sp. TRM65418]MCC3762792.1 glycosyltransferase [Glycomyces sp. TRM65418]QZD56822.1 glycosyltransferase [Glycomyces sp. TRM65418]